jgi:hypothetical protein
VNRDTSIKVFAKAGTSIAPSAASALGIRQSANSILRSAYHSVGARIRRRNVNVATNVSGSRLINSRVPVRSSAFTRSWPAPTVNGRYPVQNVTTDKTGCGSRTTRNSPRPRSKYCKAHRIFPFRKTSFHSVSTRNSAKPVHFIGDFTTFRPRSKTTTRLLHIFPDSMRPALSFLRNF